MVASQNLLWEEEEEEEEKEEEEEEEKEEEMKEWGKSDLIWDAS